MLNTALLLSCLRIFVVRIIDVSLGTVRMVLTVKEKTFLSSVVGFVEIFLWYVIVKEALSGTGPTIPIAIAYSGGFAAGTYVGGKVSKRFIKGRAVLQVVTTGKNNEVVQALRSEGYAVSVMDIRPSEFSDEKYMLFVEIDKAEIYKLQKLITDIDPKAFIMVQETKNVINSYNKH